MKEFSYTVAFLLPVKAEKTKNFKELLKYSEAMGFQSRLSHCIGNSKVLLRTGKAACTPLEVANLLIALHLLATQRKEDVVIVGAIDPTDTASSFGSFATRSGGPTLVAIDNVRIIAFP